VREGAIPTALRALADNHTLVEESQEALIPFYPFALCDQEIGTPALADRGLLPQTFPVFASEAENTFLAAAF
jgi:hypothetical protein